MSRRGRRGLLLGAGAAGDADARGAAAPPPVPPPRPATSKPFRQQEKKRASRFNNKALAWRLWRGSSTEAWRKAGRRPGPREAALEPQVLLGHPVGRRGRQARGISRGAGAVDLSLRRCEAEPVGILRGRGEQSQGRWDCALFWKLMKASEGTGEEAACRSLLSVLAGVSRSALLLFRVLTMSLNLSFEHRLLIQVDFFASRSGSPVALNMSQQSDVEKRRGRNEPAV